MNNVYEFFREALPWGLQTVNGALIVSGAVVATLLLIYYGRRHLNDRQVIKENSPLLKGLSSATVQTIQNQRINPNALKKMYEIFEQKHLPLAEYDPQITLFAERLEKLQLLLNTRESEDKGINKLKERSWQALKNGQFDKAEALLQKAYQRDLAASKTLHELPKSRLLSSATVLSLMGHLHALKLDYITAAEEHELAAQRIPEGDLYENLKIQCLNYSGAAYLNAHEFEKAEKPLVQALHIRNGALPPQSPELSAITTMFAKTFEENDIDTAEKMYQRALVTEEFPIIDQEQTDPEYAKSLTQLAHLYVKQEHYDKAEALYQEALKTRQRIHGEQHPEVAASLTDLADLYHCMGNIQLSETYHKNSIAVREVAQGKKHPDLAFNFINLGLLYQETQKYKQAGLLYRQAIEIQQAALGPKHPALAVGLHNLGSLLQEIGKYEKSAELFKKAYSILKRAYGHHHPDVAQALTHLATLYASMKRFDEAEQTFQQAISIWETIKGQDDPQTAQAYQAYATMLYDIQKIDKAEEYENKARQVLAVQVH